MTPEGLKPSPSAFDRLHDIFSKTPGGISGGKSIEIANIGLINLFIGEQLNYDEPSSYIVTLQNRIMGRTEFAVNKDGLTYITLPPALVCHDLTMGGVRLSMPVQEEPGRKINIPKSISPKDKQATADVLVDWVNRTIAEGKYIPLMINATITANVPQ